MNIRKIDLNLLPVLDVLLDELHISKSAIRLNMSQPAVSRALARLRREFDDPLIVKDSNGYRRTPRGEELAEPIRKILSEVESTMAEARFDPLTYANEFSICTLDYGEAVLVPSLQARLAKFAPKMRVRIVHRRIYSISEVLDGTADVLLGTIPDNPPKHCVAQTLYSDRHVCVVCKNHPLAAGELSVSDYLAYPHSIIHTGESPGTSIDHSLKEMGLTRTITKQSPHFVASLMSIVDTNLIQTIPERLAHSVCTSMGLVIKELPIKTGPVDIGQMWHSRFDNDAAHAWFRSQIKIVAQQACNSSD